MKNKVFVALWLLSLSVSLSGQAFGFAGLATFTDASADDVRGVAMENVIYRCIASGRAEAEKWVKGEAEAFDLDWAERLALKECAKKGGIDSKVDQCFREGAAGDQQ